MQQIKKTEMVEIAKNYIVITTLSPHCSGRAARRLTQAAPSVPNYVSTDFDSLF
jgi:hypothetical protein